MTARLGLVETTVYFLVFTQSKYKTFPYSLAVTSYEVKFCWFIAFN